MLCFEYKVVSVEYFLNQMEEWEITTFINNIPYIDRNAWEMARTQMYITAQVNSTKKLKPNDLMEFPWENTIKKKKETLTDYEIAKARKAAKEMQELISNGTFKEVGTLSLTNNNNTIQIN